MRRLLFLLAVAVQLAVLYVPAAPDVGAARWEHADTVVHMLVFAGVAWTGRLAGLSLWVIVPLLVLQAGISEVVQQQWLPTRSGEVVDAVADLAGLAIGVLVPVPPTPSASSRVGDRIRTATPEVATRRPSRSTMDP